MTLMEHSIQTRMMVPYDAEIIITFHVKKEFVFPYSTREMIKRDYDDLASKLVDIGFTEVYIN